MSGAQRALRGVRKSIAKQVKGKFAFKFRFTLTYEYVDLQCTSKLKPSNLTVLWFRSHRSKTSKKPEVKAAYTDPNTGNFIYNAAWTPSNSVELVVTLYKDGAGKFKKKEYFFVIESHVADEERKKLAIFSCDIADFASPDTTEFDLEMEFKPQSKKVLVAKLGAKIKCEFVKQGSAYEEDMESNFSHISDIEFKQRLSELTDVSDDEDDAKSAKRKSQSRESWSRFVDDMKTLEYQEYHIAMVGNPLAEAHEQHPDKYGPGKYGPESPKSPGIPNEKEMENGEEMPPPPSPFPDTLVSRVRKTRVLSALFEEDEEGEEGEDATDSSSTKTTSPLEEESKNQEYKFVFPDRKLTRSETLPDIHLSSVNDDLQESRRMQEWMNNVNFKQQEIKIRKLEAENHELRDGSKVLGQEIMLLHKEKDDLQAEICELQMLVEDLRTKINELESKDNKKPGKQKSASKLQSKKQTPPTEINSENINLKVAQVRGWLCKRGIKGLTGKRWRRRWFATDQRGRLYYYKGNNNEQPRGFIDLDIIIAVQDKAPDEQDVNNALFDVVIPGRVYELMAHDEEEKIRWINALDYLRHWRNRTTQVQGVGNTTYG